MNKKEDETPQPLLVAGIEISVAEQSPLVLALLAVIKRQEQEIQELRDEIQRLKGTTRRPKIAPSRLLKPPPDPDQKSKKRPRLGQTAENENLRIDETQVLVPDDLPPGAQLEGYRDFVVQDVVLETHDTRYRRVVYRMPDGSLAVDQRRDSQRRRPSLP